MAVWKEKIPVEEYFVFDTLEEQIAKIRGIKDIEEWLTPTEKSLHNPLLLDNIKVAAERIIHAINNQEKIVISADIDADGVTSCAIMYNYLKAFTTNLSYIYHQRTEGHGIDKQEVPENTNLLIIVDSSTNAVEKCKELKKQGIDIIIADHHPQTIDNPYCIMVNNNSWGSKYPNKDLSGAGIVLKIIQVIDSYMNINYHLNFLDLAAIGIYGDTMSMTEGENRYIVYQGLKNIKNSGVKAILKVNNNLIDYINSTTFGFSIAPVINACARMNQIELALKLLTEDDFNNCVELAKEAKKLNTSRKKSIKSLMNRIKPKINNDHAVIILEDDQIDKGFNGLVAQEISTIYQKPVMVVRNEKGKCAGSARSLNKVPLKSILLDSGLVDNAEGHEAACGVEFKEENVNKLYLLLDDTIKDYHKETLIEYDLEFDGDEINHDTIKIIEKFNYITGRNFPPIKVMVKGLEFEELKVMGQNQDTVKIVTNVMDAIKFKVTPEYANNIKSKFNAVGQLQFNSYYNWQKREVVTSPQMILEDYKIV